MWLILIPLPSNTHLIITNISFILHWLVIFIFFIYKQVINKLGESIANQTHVPAYVSQSDIYHSICSRNDKSESSPIFVNHLKILLPPEFFRIQTYTLGFHTCTLNTQTSTLCLICTSCFQHFLL